VRRLPCDAVLFDLDGVLIDSTGCVARHWTEWAEQHGLDVAAVMRIAHGLRPVDIMRLLAPHLDIEREVEKFTAAEIADTEGIVAMDGAAELLAALPQDVWTVVTSGCIGLATARLSRAGLPVPATLVAADDVQRGKPAPDPYLLGAARLGVPVERCVAVEDAPAGIEAARAAGMRVIGVAATHSPEALVRSTVVVERLSVLRITADGAAGRRLAIRVG